MSVRVRIPTPLRAATDGEAELSSDAGNVQSLIEELETRFLTGLETSLKSGDELSIVPAVAGG